MKDEDDFRGLFKALPKDLRDELLKAVEESSATSMEEFLSEIFVGPCPQCGRSNTRDCGGAAEIEDIALGLCKDCGHSWCLDCGRTVVKGSVCEHWRICARCRKKKDEFGDCAVLPWECRKISTFKTLEDEDAIHTCAWCDKRIAQDTEVFSLGAKARKGIDLKRYRGSTIRLQLGHIAKVVSAIIPTPGSPARKAGNDVLFMLCSEQCAKQLRRALLKENFTIV
ncbi:MAG TPA: hypothetical protein VKF36_17135 [Syntrophorhabdales bacterium]|nr:hypothetical protein [Syntrophorhabdales bacterium]